MKVQNLIGDSLNYAVAICEGVEYPHNYFPSNDWSQGGPIIEREGIDVNRVTDSLWSASLWINNSGMAKNPAQRFRHNIYMDGPTPLVAAMRCLVSSKLGAEVEIPDFVHNT